MTETSPRMAHEPVFPTSLTELMGRITPERIAELMKRVTFTCQVTDGVAGGPRGGVVHAYLDGVFYLASGCCVEGVHAKCLNGIDAEAVAKSNVMRAAEVRLWELEGYALYRATRPD